MGSLWKILYRIFKDFHTTIFFVGVLFTFIALYEGQVSEPFVKVRESLGLGQIISLCFGAALTVLSILLSIWGPNLKFNSMRKENPEIALSQLAELSAHPITIVFAKKVGQQVTDASIKAASPKANQFYGYPAGANILIGKGLGDLLNRLRMWMEQEDFNRFADDQRRISEEVASGGVAYAKFPMKLNEKHPELELRRKVYWPVTVGRSREVKVNKREKQEYLTIMYLDIDLLPRECRETLI